MAPRTLPGVGLQGFETAGESGWNSWNDTNMMIASALIQARVKSVVAVVPTTGLANGDMHILTGAPNANAIALRDNGAWVYLTPQTGYRVYDQATALTFVFTGSAWSPENADLTATTNGPALELKKKGSGAGANAPNAAFSSMGSFRWLGWTGSVWRTGAQILVQTQELWSGVASGTAIVFQVIASGATTMVDRLQLTATALTPAQTDNVVSLGSRTAKWLKGWFGSISIYPDTTPYPSDNGEVTIASYADDTITILKKGADGVVRKIDLTLTP